jgi:hypothetical protein
LCETVISATIWACPGTFTALTLCDTSCGVSTAAFVRVLNGQVCCTTVAAALCNRKLVLLLHFRAL